MALEAIFSLKEGLFHSSMATPFRTTGPRAFYLNHATSGVPSSAVLGSFMLTPVTPHGETPSVT